MSSSKPLLLTRVRSTLKERNLVRPSESVLVACSGGADSLAMLYAFAELSSSFEMGLHVASVNHQLRDNAADDVEFVRQHALTLGLPFHGLCVELPKEPSIQNAARKVRYRALLALKDKIGATKIAIAHTLDDQAETVLDRLLRGAAVWLFRALRRVERMA
ncbi:MAG: tRNA lysidine(34) synthetase TilS [Myxococcales bacterium]|nr:MAG: tRNA lysidine(34) synthetase TilS [Myxococcales bacterium]